MAGHFEVGLPVMKAWSDEAGIMWFEGVASSTRLDRQRERMTPAALVRMSKCAGLDLLPSHKAGPLESLGTVEQCWAEEESLRVVGTLDADSPQARALFKRLQSGKEYGLSVGGRVSRAHWAWDAEVGQQVRHIDEVELKHIAVCWPWQAANPDTYLSALGKAAEEVAGAAPRSPGEAGGLLEWIKAAVVAAWREIVGGGREGAEETGRGSEPPPACADAGTLLRAQTPAPLQAGRGDYLGGDREADETGRRGAPQSLRDCCTPCGPASGDGAEADGGGGTDNVEGIAAGDGGGRSPRPTTAGESGDVSLHPVTDMMSMALAKAPEEEAPLPGRRQSLPLAGAARKDNDHLWKGVL